MAKVLVIDDDANNRLLLTTLLRHAGHMPLEAATGLSGIEAALNERPDLIVVDLSLPDIPGVQVIRRLRGESATSKLRIALYTATQNTPAIDELVETYRISGIVPKPGDPKQILKAFETLLSSPH